LIFLVGKVTFSFTDYVLSMITTRPSLMTGKTISISALPYDGNRTYAWNDMKNRNVVTADIKPRDIYQQNCTTNSC